MLNIAIIGVIITLITNIPAILYLVWGWKLLWAHANKVGGHQMRLRSAGVWSRLVLWAIVVSLVWPLWAFGASITTYFLLYQRNGEALAFAEAWVTIAYLPITISSWIGEHLPGLSVSSGADLLRWVLLAASLAAILLVLASLEFMLVRAAKLITHPGPREAGPHDAVLD